MELVQLEHFVILAEHLHFRRAAAAAGVSTSTLSRQIGDLEADLAVRLFDRNRRQVNLTPAGEAFLDETKAVLHRLRFAAVDARRAGSGSRHVLRVGHGDAVGLTLLQSALPGLRRGFDDLRLEIVEAPTEELLKALAARSLDLALVRPPVHPDGLDHFHLCDEDLVVVLPDGHRLRSERHVTPEELAGEPLVVPPRTSAPGAYDAVMAVFALARVSPNVVQEGSSAASMLLLVAAGLGTAVIPVHSTRHLDLGGIVTRPLGVPAALGLHVAWRSGEEPEVLVALRTALVEAVRARAGTDSGLRLPPGED